MTVNLVYRESQNEKGGWKEEKRTGSEIVAGMRGKKEVEG